MIRSKIPLDITNLYMNKETVTTSIRVNPNPSGNQSFNINPNHFRILYQKTYGKKRNPYG